uniref:RING-type domain-containing protein n=1 Tax=Vombatus ursinus TaxID=29139 RepID=A0A4X2LTF4_VOMUR
MPIHTFCIIYLNFFDHSLDVATIHCGHTFPLMCLIKRFSTAPSYTCPQCQIQVHRRSIINKLFFDLVQKEETGLDAETLKNEMEKTGAQLSLKLPSLMATCWRIPESHPGHLLPKVPNGDSFCTL